MNTNNPGSISNLDIEKTNSLLHTSASSASLSGVTGVTNLGVVNTNSFSTPNAEYGSVSSSYTSAESSPKHNSLINSTSMTSLPHSLSAASFSSNTAAQLTTSKSQLCETLTTSDLAMQSASSSFSTLPTNSEDLDKQCLKIRSDIAAAITDEDSLKANCFNDKLSRLMQEKCDDLLMETHSLPPFMPGMDLNKLNDPNKITSLQQLEQKLMIKKEASESDLHKLNVKQGNECVQSIINKAVSSAMNQVDEQEKPQLAQTSPSKMPAKQNSVLSFIERMMFKSPSSDLSLPHQQQQQQPLKSEPIVEYKAEPKETTTVLEDKTNKIIPVALLSTTSSSSPNPDCSPYKLLNNELTPKYSQSNLVKSESKTLNVTEQVKKTELNNEKLIENLASMNHKEHEQADPILSASKSTPNELFNSHSTDMIAEPSSTSSLVPEELKTNTTLQTLPASSQEFCMNLNFNLAAAAASTAGGPIAIVDNSKPNSTSPQQTQPCLEHTRFTSNASTSSIHNDLKMILEESKDLTNQSKNDTIKQEDTDQLLKQVDQAQVNKKESPKPQRTHQHHHHHHNKTSKQHSPSKNQHHNKQQQQQNLNVSNTSNTETEKEKEKDNESSLNLIKLMMMMVENSKTTSTDENQENKPVKYRYSKELLTQIKEQRSDFIDQIYPDIFKAYCYCMNGKYWDPEKYFDIVQFPGDYEKIQANQSLNKVLYRQNNNNNNSNTSQGQRQQNNMNRNRKVYNNNNNQQSMNKNVNKLGDDITSSPQPLQVPKNSPKQKQRNTSKYNYSSGVSSYSSSLLQQDLGLSDLNKQDADKILLNMIKKDKNPSKVSNENTNSTNLLNLLNKKPENPHVLKNQSQNILNDLFVTSSSSSSSSTSNQQNIKQVKTQSAVPNNIPKHFPLILTAQELEMSQLNQQKQQVMKLPISNNENYMQLLGNELNVAESETSSDAYKQLVKNLNNHPLNPTHIKQGNKNVDEMIMRLQQKLPTSSNSPTSSSSSSMQSNSPTNNTNNTLQVANDGTKILKQLLNLNSTSFKNSEYDLNDEKKSKSKRHHQHQHHHHSHHQHQHHHKHKSSNKSDLFNEPAQFPAMNPHEKPFENYFGDKMQKTTSHHSNANNNRLIENLIQNLKIQHQQPVESSNTQHFNALLSKIIPSQHEQLKKLDDSSSSDILKWFTGTNCNQSQLNKPTNLTPTSLSEIELMDHRPKLF